MNRRVIVEEWRRATRSLEAADVLAREAYGEDAVSRAYNAVLHAAKAALLVHGVAPESHAGVRRMFGQHLVRTGELEAQWSKRLTQHSDDRLAADYDAGVFFSAEDAQEECGQARAFIDRIRRYLSAKGLTEQELAPERGDG